MAEQQKSGLSLFGFEIKRKGSEEEKKKDLPSFTPKEQDDGAVVVAAGGAYGSYIDLDGTVRTEAELVTKYREMSLHPECDAAVDEIVNECVSIDEETYIKINLDDVKLSDNVKNIITDEFENCLKIIEFEKYAYDIIRRWYVDGRLYYHVVIDDNNPKAGIQELRYIDPRKIRKIREVQKKRIQAGNIQDAVMTKTVNEYFIYNEKGFNFGSKVSGPTTQGLKIAKDSILHIVSGLTDNQGTMVLSYLHKAIKALNQLRTLEDALVIYRLARAPERRIWYIDVGNLPKMKAEQYVRDIMVKHKNRLIYDASTGEIRDDRKFMTMLEDYWLPRREGGRGTEVTTLPGGQTLGQMDDVLYFQKKFLQTLNVPISRLNSDAMFSVGRATEITRDELKFARFVIRLRQRFSILFTRMLEKQLVLKGIMTLDEWKEISSKIKFDFAKDNYFTELKNNEINQGRVQLADMYQNYAGKYYSHEWIRKNVMQQTDDDIKEQDKEINAENKSQDPRWLSQAVMMNQQTALGLQQQELGNQQQAMQTQQMMNPPDQPQPSPEEQQQQQATDTVQQMRQNPNRSIQDEAKMKQAQLLLQKNKQK